MTEGQFTGPEIQNGRQIQDGGHTFWMLWTKKLRMVLKNHHPKYGAWCQFVTGSAIHFPYSLINDIDLTKKNQNSDSLLAARAEVRMEPRHWYSGRRWPITPDWSAP